MKYVLFLSLFIGFAAQSKVVGKVYKKGDLKKQIMTFEREDKKTDAGYTAVTFFKGMDGAVLLKDTTSYDPKGLKSTQIEHSQLKFTSMIKTEGNKALFDYTGENKKKDSNTESSDNPFLVGSMLSIFIKRNWDAIVGGKTLNFNMAVPARNKSFGFRVAKIENRTVNGKTYTTFRMEPSSWLVRQAVDPLFLMFDKDKKLRVYEGRLAVKLADGGDLKDLDATVLYDYM